MSALDIDRTRASWIAFARIFVGVFWLYEVFLGGRWKLGTPASGTNPEWVGLAAGAEINEVGSEALADGTWLWTASLLETVILPYAGFWSNLVTFSQIVFGIAMILGAFTRLVSVGALFQLGLIVHFGPAGIGPIMAVGHLFALVTDAGRYHGVDGWLARHSSRTAIGRLGSRLATIGTIPRNTLPSLAAGTAILALYYLLVAVQHGGETIPTASLELAVLFGLGAFAFAFEYRGIDHVTIGADLVRLFVGYRLLYEIFVNTEPAIDKLPGWASTGEITPIFAEIATEHFAIVGAFVETVLIPSVEVWIVVFAAIQTAVAVALLVGWRTKAASTLGVAYLGSLIALGFTRYAPFLLGLLFVVWGLGGRSLGLDDIAGRTAPSLRLSRWNAPLLLATGLAATGLALSTGVAPNGYETTMGSVAAAMVAIFTTLLGMTALFQRRPMPSRSRETADSRPTSG